jgi:hypothetical protein
VVHFFAKPGEFTCIFHSFRKTSFFPVFSSCFFRKTPPNLLYQALWKVEKRKGRLFSTKVFRKVHFFHGLFPMAALLAAGSFDVSFSCKLATVLNAAGKPKTGF